MQSSHVHREPKGHGRTDRKTKGQGSDDFGISITETRGACVITVFWPGQKWATEQDGLGRRS
jgi:hypothetical protein